MWAREMKNFTAYKLIILLILMATPLLGGTGRPSDGLLSFLVVLGFLVLLLAIIQLCESLPRLIDRIIDRVVGDISPSNGNLL